jgi:hypothetical protein
MTRASKLEAALARGLAPCGDLIQELANLRDYPIRAAQDAQAICLALTRIIELPPETPDVPVPTRSGLDWLAGLLQQVESPEAYEILVAFGLPQLYRLFDERSSRLDLLFLLKLFALYRDRRGTERIIQAVREDLSSQGQLWSVIFRQFDQEHPDNRVLLDALRDPLPQGFIAVAYLDWCNALALAEQCAHHPFDSSAGQILLHDYLTDPDPHHFSFAQSAAASLPFLHPARRQDLLALALDHPCADVQMEGAWASAKLGSAAGVHFLARLCLDPARSKQAAQYLCELDLEEAIPQQAKDAQFQAQAALSSWLAHPQEFGRPPEEMVLLDTRELYWPPTRDRRRVWLFRYRYEVPADPEETDTTHHLYETGVGMVGSITFSLLGETHPDMPPEDLYALHCCWELEYRSDQQAPAERGVAAGRRLLAQHQSGFST